MRTERQTIQFSSTELRQYSIVMQGWMEGLEMEAVNANHME